MGVDSPPSRLPGLGSRFHHPYPPGCRSGTKPFLLFKKIQSGPCPSSILKSAFGSHKLTRLDYWLDSMGFVKGRNFLKLYNILLNKILPHKL